MKLLVCGAGVHRVLEMAVCGGVSLPKHSHTRDLVIPKHSHTRNLVIPKHSHTQDLVKTKQPYTGSTDS